MNIPSAQLTKYFPSLEQSILRILLVWPIRLVARYGWLNAPLFFQLEDCFFLCCLATGAPEVFSFAAFTGASSAKKHTLLTADADRGTYLTPFSQLSALQSWLYKKLYKLWETNIKQSHFGNLLSLWGTKRALQTSLVYLCSTVKHAVRTFTILTQSPPVLQFLSSFSCSVLSR